MTRSRSIIAPHHRGLLSAVAWFAVLLFVGVGWVLWANKAPAITLEPSYYVSSSYEAGEHSRLREDEHTMAYRANGALVGYADVLTGDTLRIEGSQYRLWGVTAFHGYSHCGSNAHGWACGTQPAAALNAFVSGYLIACFDRGVGINGEPVAQCMRGLLDVGGFMVANGMAGAVPQETRAYQLKVEIAKAGNHGFWSVRRP